jgi:hypothetical protein
VHAGAGSDLIAASGEAIGTGASFRLELSCVAAVGGWRHGHDGAFGRRRSWTVVQLRGRRAGCIGENEENDGKKHEAGPVHAQDATR